MRSCSATGVHLLTSRFEDYSRCDRPWVKRSDGMMSAMIRPAGRTSIALLKPSARSLRFLRGLARARFECSTCWVTKPSASFAMRPCMPSWRSLSRQAPEGTLSAALVAHVCVGAAESRLLCFLIRRWCGPHERLVVRAGCGGRRPLIARALDLSATGWISMVNSG